ncbi:MAG: dipeptidase [Candidatus Marinimicrobia bacterium]|nr:dipeptidase [Candidatus Neomarinimicrobiota bacterium]
MIIKNRLQFFLLLLFVFTFFSCGKKDEEITLKAKLIHDRILTVDTHSDTPLLMIDSTWDIGVRHETEKVRDSKIDLPRMEEGGLDVEFFAAYVGQRERTPEKYKWAKARAVELISVIKVMCEKYGNIISLGIKPGDAYKNHRAGLLTAYIGMENGFPIGMDLENVKYYFDQGVRYITLCHYTNNDICDSSTDPDGPEHHGLSDFGRQIVKEMNRLGMIIDVSHISDESFYDVLEVSKAPVIASHSCTRALCDHPRNMSDKMIQALAAKGGVIQMCFFTGYVKKERPNRKREAALDELEGKYGPWNEIEDSEIKEEYRKKRWAIMKKYPRRKTTVKKLVDHIDHVIKLVGVDYVGIGTDFDGGGGLIGCNDISEMVNVTKELVRKGYSEEDIEKIWGGNFMRVFREVVKISEQDRIPNESIH